MRCLHFITAKFNLLLSAVHLAGSDNELADALSRNNLPYFLSNHPQAICSPSRIPPALLDLLIYAKPDWTSPSWSKAFNTTFNQLCQPIPSEAMHLATGDSWTSALGQDWSHTLPLNQHCANLPPTLVRNTLSSSPSSAISLESDSAKFCKPTSTLSSATCQGSSTYFVASSSRKRKRDENPLNDSQ